MRKSASILPLSLSLSLSKANLSHILFCYLIQLSYFSTSHPLLSTLKKIKRFTSLLLRFFVFCLFALFCFFLRVVLVGSKSWLFLIFFFLWCYLKLHFFQNLSNLITYIWIFSLPNEEKNLYFSSDNILIVRCCLGVFLFFVSISM